jgi:hypothetical protein
MRLQFQLLNSKKYALDNVDPDVTVAAIKQRLVDTHKLAPAIADLKLIHTGKVWADTLVLSSVSKFKETDMIVCMVSKPKVKPASPPAPTEASAAAAASASPSDTDASMAVIAEPAAAAAPAPVVAPVAAAAPLQLQADAVLNPPMGGLPLVRAGGGGGVGGGGGANEAVIAELMAMGFARNLCEGALVRTFHQADAAAELLFQVRGNTHTRSQALLVSRGATLH